MPSRGVCLVDINSGPLQSVYFVGFEGVGYVQGNICGGIFGSLMKEHVRTYKNSVLKIVRELIKGESF